MLPRKITLLILVLFALVPVQVFAARLAKVTILVVGEDGTPINGASVYVSRDGPGGIANKGSSDERLTGIDGKQSFSMINYNGYVAYGADKDGYYNSHYKMQFTDASITNWKPWNHELTVVLRKIENPVPMYARERKIEIPELDKDIGFDLIAFDWVAPYGTGEYADFIFNANRKRMISRKDFDGTLTITFTNKFDGIKIHRETHGDGSKFKLPRFAPVDGYESKIVFNESRQPNDHGIKRNFDFVSNDINYLFRIRTTEKDGRVIGMYGKISGRIDFSIVHSKTASIYFNYYLNPDLTRNLEFNTDRNLFKSIDLFDRVNQP